MKKDDILSHIFRFFCLYRIGGPFYLVSAFIRR
jgi:hypothetical protein